MLGTLDETILKGNLEIIPRRFAYYGDAPEWMKKILPTEEQIKHIIWRCLVSDSSSQSGAWGREEVYTERTF